ncbi:MAG: adenylyl-sulfate kinase, partial [Clostridia bacterium]|nr:adenylyl-sulfate kinase [Clostridia bacterium]
MNKNITPYLSSVTASDRMKITGARPCVFWMTGLSGSGKSTVAAIAEKMLISEGISAMMIDGDTVRTGLCAGLGFSVEDRHENLRRIAHLARIIALSGQAVIVCTISPDAESRANARAIIEPDVLFREVYVKASADVCASRDPKGLYKKAFAGEIKNFTGVSAPYEIPLTPDLVLDTTSGTAQDCAQDLVHQVLLDIRHPRELIGEMMNALLLASEKILEIYNSNYDIDYKDDKSPLTTADLASNEIITKHLRSVYPEYDILSEEEADASGRLSNNAGVFILDPIDGTKEFINRNGEFCVSLGFAVRNRVIAGVIAVPVQGLLYYAAEGMGAYKTTFDQAHDHAKAQRLHVSDRTEQVIVVASRSHPDRQTAEILERNEKRILDTISVGSCLKGCYIAEGLADVHYRYGAFMK